MVGRSPISPAIDETKDWIEGPAPHPWHPLMSPERETNVRCYTRYTHSAHSIWCYSMNALIFSF